MKRSIFIALLILASVVGWIGSGQFSNNVVAQDENIEALSESDTSYSQNNDNKESEEFTFSVETKIFNSSLIDQSIELEGQTIHNKKIDVKSETSGNIDSLKFSRGDKVSENLEMITISLESLSKSFSALKSFSFLSSNEIVIISEFLDTLSPLENSILLIFPDVSDLTSIFLL